METAMKQIYKITNIKNSKSYIGIVIAKDKDYIKRFNEHMTGKGGVWLWKDIDTKNYIVDDFVTELLEEGNEPDEYYRDCEIYYIGYFDTLYPRGYNGNCGNYIVMTPEIIAKAQETRRKNKEDGVIYKPSGNPGYAVYRYQDGCIKKLPTDHPDVVNGIVTHINYNSESKGRLESHKKEMEREKNGGKTDAEIAFSKKIKIISKDYINNAGWQKGRENHRLRVAKKMFTEKEKELHKKIPEIVKKQWESIPEDQKLQRCSPGLTVMNSKIICENCGTETNKGNYSRWHGKNCKHHQ